MEFNRETQPAAGPPWRVVFGLLIVSYGVFLTLGNAGWGGAYRILDHYFFGAAMLVLGAVKFMRSDTGVGKGLGLTGVAIGAVMLIGEALRFRIHIDQLWPLVIVAAGVLLIAKAGGALKWRRGVSGPADASAVAVMSGVQRKVASPAFGRADFAAFMGGIEVDLRQATTAGGTAVVDLFIVMGGVEITVPPDWVVKNEAVVIMGGVEDGSSGSRTSANTLILRGLVWMGGVEIKT